MIAGLWQALRTRLAALAEHDGGLRPIARLYLYSVVLTALGIALVTLPQLATLDLGQLPLAMALAATMTCAGVMPLPFVARTKLCLDSAILLAVVLLFPAALAMLVVGLATTLAQTLRRQKGDQAVFNVAQVILLAYAGSQIVALAGWDAGRFALTQFSAVALAVAVGAGLWALNLLCVALMIGSQEAIAPRRIVAGLVIGNGRAGALTQSAEVVLGIGLTLAAMTHGHALLALLLATLLVHGFARQVAWRQRLASAPSPGQ
jgi:hypothetical protein